VKIQYINEIPINNPSYLTASDDGSFVYAVSEDINEKARANAFSFDKQRGILNLINSQETKSDSPCYISLDSGRRHAITANYSGGSISVFNIRKNGSLEAVSQVIEFSGKGKDKERQTQPHLHCVKFSPDEKFLFATDLGTDNIYRFGINENDIISDYISLGNMLTTSITLGSGPKLLDFHPNRKFLYLINELVGTIKVYRYENGIIDEIQNVATNKDKAGESADIHVSPDGRFLYISNRLENDGIVIFSIDEKNGLLTEVGFRETAKHPRSLTITPDGKYLFCASHDENIIEIYKIENKSGLLTDTKKRISVSNPTCLLFIPGE